MCHLSRKQILFNDLVYKLIDWHREICDDRMSTNDEILKNFGFIRLMKLLYFVCLQSVNENVKSVDNTLFGVFDNFLPLENGPAEIDVYNNRSILPSLSFDGSFLYEKKQDIERLKLFYSNLKGYEGESTGVLDYLIEKEDPKHRMGDYRTMIDNSIKELMKKGASFPFNDRQKLVDLSHELILWELANRFSSPLFTNNIALLRKEKDAFEKKINPQQ